MWNPSFGRLIWKEYRTQRSVWLSLLGGTVLLQVVMAWSLDSRALGPGAFVLAYVLSACYAAACAGILFAGEREEETDACLRQLPLRKGPLLTAKFLFAIATVAAFVGVALLGGWMASNLAHASLEDVLKNDLTFWARSVVGALVWGLLFSLLLRRVLVVVLCTAVTELIVTAVAGNLTLVHEHRIYFTIVGAVACVDLWLGLRWAAGEAGLPVPRVRWLAERADRSPSQRWLRWLTWTLQCGSPLVRTCGALTWRELRAAALFCLWWALLGVLLVDLLPRLFGFPSNALFLVATPLGCGLLVCLADQRQQTYRFLSERGVSAVTVWACKQAVWLTLAIVLVAAFAAWDVVAAERFRIVGIRSPYQGVGTFVDVIRYGIHMPAVSLRAPFDAPADRALQWSFVWSLGLSLYVLGQLASFWIRRSALAVGACLIGATLLGVWSGLLVKADIPLARGVWPALAVWSIATLFMAGRWLRGDDSWRTRLLQCAWVIAPVLAVGAASASYRAQQVPLVDPGFQWPSREYAMEQFNREWSQQWQELLSALNLYVARGRPDAGSDDPAAEQIAAQLLALGEALARPHGGIDPLLLPPGEPHQLVAIGPILADAARRHEDEGDLSAGRSHYVAGLRVTRYLSQQCSDWNSWDACLTARGYLLEGARRGSAHPNQTPESLREAFDALSQETRKAIFARDMLMNRYVFYRQLLERRGRMWSQIEGEVSLLSPGHLNGALVCAWTPAFERQRIHRLVALATARSLSPSDGVTAASVDADDLARWRTSTPLLPVDFSADLTGGATWDGSHQELFRLTLAAEHGTRLVLALQHYRRQHGEFPERLEALLGDYFNQLPRDPYSNGWFGYEPSGFPTPIHVTGKDTIAAGQPLLWSSGAGNGRILRVGAHDIESGPGGIMVPADHYYVTNWGLSATESAREPRTWELDADRVVFAILGRSVDQTTLAAARDDPAESPADGDDAAGTIEDAAAPFWSLPPQR